MFRGCNRDLTNASTLDVKYSIRGAAIDTTNDRKVNYDTLVFFDENRGITAGPAHLKLLSRSSHGQA